MPDPITPIVDEIVARLNAREFHPFSLLLSDGSRYDIPTRDHCTVTRLLRRIEIEHDNGSSARFNPLTSRGSRRVNRLPEKVARA